MRPCVHFVAFRGVGSWVYLEVMMGLPEKVWVVVRSTGEYSDREETPIRYCLSEEDAKAAVEAASIEAQRDADKKPQWRSEHSLAWQTPDGEFVSSDWHGRPAGSRLRPLPNADAIEAQNEGWRAEYWAACRALGHVDPQGSWSGDQYYYAEVTLWHPSPAP